MQRLGVEAKSLRIGLSWTQALLGRRAGVSQASVARLEAGDVRGSISIVVRIFAALGSDLPLRAYPGTGVGLRDSGQLPMAEAIRALAHPSWRIVLEAPTGDDGNQAADMLFLLSEAGVHIELESALSDFQAQLRRGHLKRDGLQQRHERSVAFVMGLRDTERNRTAVAAHLMLIKAALPASSRDVLAAIRQGRPVDRDGLLWIRARGRQ